MEGCGWDPDPVCSASPETAEGLRAEARGQLRPQVRGERKGTEPAGGAPGWENGVSAQTRGPGARWGRARQGTGDRQTCWAQGEGLGRHRQYTGGACLPSLPSPGFREETGLCWGRGGANQQEPQDGRRRHVTQDCQETGRAKNRRNTEDTGRIFRGPGVVRVGGQKASASQRHTALPQKRCRLSGLRRSSFHQRGCRSGRAGRAPRCGPGFRGSCFCRGSLCAGEKAGGHGNEGPEDSVPGTGAPRQNQHALGPEQGDRVGAVSAQGWD